ncbi:hypothetical protein TTHERM_00572080 (macronuclear) [Tetrahymena thermophila SB210]|uniref:Uncharacterized protein n=1 Tax=Tetrahymena thermophila (strain SB210) TaxID=312017 RepID=Q24HW6_TETTS|nr:hypothetical protein TTHERM_00572080 [Tetrahymena thermophila SB210]EAS07472.2 hypothetical protein TTHERM_00572080 [Tetrahymena thermophila SB210]|eukprot:XP_001027714.2 hypothetical protein TTHERM_00572080 [Tetrahymena thermophila SB210]
MGNLCYKNMREPQNKQARPVIGSYQSESSEFQQHYSTNIKNQDQDTLKEQNSPQKNAAPVEQQMKAKKINTKKLCRPSRVIQEQISMNNRDNDQYSCASYYSGHYETQYINGNDSEFISVFLNSNPNGQQVKIGDNIILRNLKDHFYLFCKYQKLKKYDKQNLVKLEKQKDDHNEMYLTWKFKSIHQENGYINQQQQQQLQTQSSSQNNEEENESSPEMESIDMDDVEIENNQHVKIQHSMTSCYLQSNKNFRHDAQSKFNNGFLVSGGPHNRLTSNQQWQIEIVYPSTGQEEQTLRVNQLFRIKHTETNTYLTSIANEVFCINVDEINKQLEEQKNNESIQEVIENSISKEDGENEKKRSYCSSPTDLVEQNNGTGKNTNNEHDLTPTTFAADSKNENQQKKDQEDRSRASQLQITNDIRRSERFSVDSVFQKKQAQKLYLDSFQQEQQGQNTYIDVNCKSTEQIEIANLINDEAMSDNGESLFKLKQQQVLNDQINNDFYKMNNYSQYLMLQEKEMIRKKQEQFLLQILNGDLWYVSEIIPHQ